MSFSKEGDLSTRYSINRRQFLRSGTCLAAAGVSTLLLPRLANAQNVPTLVWNPPSNGSKDPCPIPWLDRNGSHNQSPGPGLEPSSIYHFKGQIARCNNFTGIGTDNKGNRISFGAPSTDFSFLKGEYFAARSPQSGIFSHI
jgi:hypothetical protein